MTPCRVGTTRWFSSWVGVIWHCSLVVEIRVPLVTCKKLFSLITLLLCVNLEMKLQMVHTQCTGHTLFETHKMHLQLVSHSGFKEKEYLSCQIHFTSSAFNTYENPTEVSVQRGIKQNIHLPTLSELI